MAHIIFKGILVVFEIGAAAPKNNEKNVETSPWVCLWLSPLVVNLQSKIKGITLKKMNERSAKETRKVVGIKKDATLNQKPWEE